MPKSIVTNLLPWKEFWWLKTIPIIELAGIHLKDIHCELTEASNGFEGLASTNSTMQLFLTLCCQTLTVSKFVNDWELRKLYSHNAYCEKRGNKIIGLETGADDYLQTF
jgi:hypothetical protein